MSSLIFRLEHHGNFVVYDDGDVSWVRDPDCQEAISEIERLRGHSTLLNAVAWRIHEAMGVIPEGATEHLGNIESELDEICAAIRRGVNRG